MYLFNLIIPFIWLLSIVCVCYRCKIDHTLSKHSVDVKHVPCPSSEVALHTSFENFATLYNPRTEDFKIIVWKLDLQSKVRAHLSKWPAFLVPKQISDDESSFAGHIMQTIIHICLRKNKSKQSYVWIDSIFEAQSICFETEKACLLNFSYNKCALAHNFIKAPLHSGQKATKKLFL